MMLVFFFNDTATTEIYTLSLHDALPISGVLRDVIGRDKELVQVAATGATAQVHFDLRRRSEEHTSELQSPCNLVCRLLLEKKNTPQQSPADVALPCDVCANV